MSESTTGGRLKLVLATHDEKVLDVECDQVALPGRLGELGVLPGHMPLLTILSVGELRYRDGKRETSLAISWGFAEVADDVVTVLAEFAQRPDEIDVAGAKAEIESAYEVLSVGGREEVKEALAKLELASARIQVAERN